MCDKHGDTVRDHAYELLEACKAAVKLLEIGTWGAIKQAQSNLETVITDAEGGTP